MAGGRGSRVVTLERFASGMTFDWGAVQQSPFFKVWASAAIDEMLSALYEQRVLGALPDPCRA